MRICKQFVCIDSEHSKLLAAKPINRKMFSVSENSRLQPPGAVRYY